MGQLEEQEQKTSLETNLPQTDLTKCTFFAQPTRRNPCLFYCYGIPTTKKRLGMLIGSPPKSRIRNFWFDAPIIAKQSAPLMSIVIFKSIFTTSS